MSHINEKDEPGFGQAGVLKPDQNLGADLEARRTSTSVNGRRMSRIGPPPKQSLEIPVTDNASSVDEYGKLVEMEANDAIQYRTCSWQKTAALLFSEYICLAIMSFPYSYSVLGLVPGIILTVVQAGFVLYTSLVVWEFCLRHPEVRDVCDIGQMLFWNSKWAWYATAVMFLLNNTFIQGLHVLVISRYLNTMSGHSVCTVGFAAIGAIISWVCSMPRTFNTLSKLAAASAVFTFISVILAAAFAGAEGKHGTAGYNPDPNFINAAGKNIGGEPLVLAIPLAGTTFVSGMNAFLNIAYTFIGQITLPSFIAEMKNPYDFRKALWLVTICEIVVFCLVGGIVYGYTGTQYNTAPAFGSLGNEIYKKVSFSFMVPTLIFLGVLYASVSARFLFFRIFEGTRHKTSHTVVGWATWAGILAVTWVMAFIIAEVIPFFADLLSLMSSLFDSFFGWIFWGVAYLRMRKADLGPGFYKKRGIRGWVGFIVNIFIILVGVFFLGAGTYASVDSIILDYDAGNVKGVFTCADNSL
ncbi:hypothetical protein LTR84_010619 [Exophiala bonariae]|uniref:Amino acid transporter transmembrane domain-containing protein n=1 Tax=Exophiala bonariae TaxID=1690606 RepID=A0AAV9MV94_9EURO|nr:hypothetical protein LTR84_010619 [Exophiala bonariae]